MSKLQFQDIVPPEKRSIKRIPVPERERRAEEPKPAIKRTPTAPRSKRKFPLKTFGVIVLLALLGVGAYFLIPKAIGADIRITPKGISVDVKDLQFSGTADLAGEIYYQISTLSKEGKMIVEASGTENVEVKATGVIRIFNNAGSAPQKLVGNTRFEATGGLIYRITESVTIPGKSGDTPGSVDVKVVADKPGEDFNIGLSDFTVPGFKGDPKYKTIFARSVTPMKGGFIGARAKVSASDENSATEKIKEDLKANLVSQISKSVPVDFILLNNAVYIEFEKVLGTSTATTAEVKQKATAHGILFRKADLAKSLSRKTTGDSIQNVDIIDVSKLNFSVVGSQITKPWAEKSLAFMLSGSAVIAIPIDTEKLKAELAGKPKNSFNAILSAYPGIEKGDATIRPFWRSVFPADPGLIRVQIGKVSVSP